MVAFSWLLSFVRTVFQYGFNSQLNWRLASFWVHELIISKENGNCTATSKYNIWHIYIQGLHNSNFSIYSSYICHCSLCVFCVSPIAYSKCMISKHPLNYIVLHYYLLFQTNIHTIWKLCTFLKYSSVSVHTVDWGRANLNTGTSLSHIPSVPYPTYKYYLCWKN